MRALSSGRGHFRSHRSCAVHNRPTKFYIIILALRDYYISLAQSVEPLTLISDFAGSRPVGATIFFLQIIFLNLSPLLLICISDVFDVSRV